MKLTLESTTKILELRLPSGAVVPARVWQGRTDSGIEVHAYITRVAVHNEKDTTEFARELVEQTAPRPEIAALPARLVL